MKSIFSAVGVVICLIIGTAGLASAAEESSRQPAAGIAPQQMAGQEETKKVVAARVNGVDITMKSVVMMMKRIAAQKGHAADTSVVGMEEIKKDALNRLIIEELAFQRARADGLKVEQAAIDTAVDTLKQNLGGEEKYKEFLEKESLTEKELRARIERNSILDIFFTKEVLNKIVVSEDEVKKEYATEKETFMLPEKVSVIDVVFFLNTEDKDSLMKAEETLKKINDDKDKNPWVLPLDGTFIVQDIDIKKEKEQKLYEEAKKLKAGELSGVIKTPDSLHIIKLKAYSPERKFTFEEVKGNIEANLRARAQRERFLALQTELKKEAKIEIIETEESK